jgi:hypothetical protein
MQPDEIERIPPPPPPKQKATAPVLPAGLVFVVLTLLALLVQKVRMLLQKALLQAT